MIDLPPPTALWTPPKPAIIHSAEAHLTSAWLRLAPRAMRRGLVRDMLRAGLISRRDAANAIAATTNLTPLQASLLITQLIGFGAGGSNLNLSYLTKAASATDLTTYTFSTLSLGAVAGDRYIIVGVAGAVGAARTISSVTVGGVGATAVAYNQTPTYAKSAIYIAAVPTGTTGDVVVVWSAGMADCGVTLYRATGINPTAVDTLSTGANVATSTTGSIDSVAGGVIVGNVAFTDASASYQSSASKAYAAAATQTVGGSFSGATYTWTELTQDDSQTVESVALANGQAIAAGSFAAV
jgi:hypothetical protein